MGSDATAQHKKQTIKKSTGKVLTHQIGTKHTWKKRQKTQGADQRILIHYKTCIFRELIYSLNAYQTPQKYYVACFVSQQKYYKNCIMIPALYSADHRYFKIKLSYEMKGVCLWFSVQM